MASYCSLFYTFFKIGSFTIGGGYAMVPLMQQEIVERHRWLDNDEFIDVLTVSQSMPGVLAVNMATSVGYRLRGVGGAVAATLGNIIMPIVFILLLAIVFNRWGDNEVVGHIFMGLRPAVVALIAAPVFNMARSLKIGWQNFWIPLLSALLIWLFGVSPVVVILAAAVGGFLFGRLKRK